MDPALRTLAHAAEAGRDCPPVRLLLASGDLAMGRPGPSSQFLQAMYGPLAAEYAGGLARRDRKHVDTDALAGEELLVIGRAQQSLDGPEPMTLTLYDASLLATQGGGVELPAVRVPLEAINAWWIAGGSTIEAPREGGGWFVGGFAAE